MLHTRTKQRTLNIYRSRLSNTFRTIIMFLYLHASYTVHRKILFMSDVKNMVRINQ